MEALIILGAIIVIVVAACAASEFKKIAEMKGHIGGKYFWWSFLLGPVGMLMVVALPDRGVQIPSAFSANIDHIKTGGPDDDLPEL